MSVGLITDPAPGSGRTFRLGDKFQPSFTLRGPRKLGFAPVTVRGRKGVTTARPVITSRHAEPAASVVRHQQHTIQTIRTGGLTGTGTNSWHNLDSWH